jgi:hypothetical protein
MHPWETTVAVGSAIVALCALGLSIAQAYATRTHDRLSLMPHLEFSIGMGQGDSVFISVTNNGLGPARILGMEFQFDGKFHRAAGEMDYRRMFSDFGVPWDSVASLGDVYYTAPSINSYITPGQTMALLTLHHPRDSTATAKFAALVDAVDPLICYASIYGDLFYASPQAGISNPNSCRFDGTVRLLGRRVRFYNPIDPPLDPEETHGLPP